LHENVHVRNNTTKQKRVMAKPKRTQSKRARRVQQYGGRVTVFRGAPLQRGHGLGGLFKTLFRVAVPLIRRAAPIVKRVAVRAGKSVAKRAVKAGARVINDVASNQSTLKDALKNRAQEAALQAAMDAINKGAPSRKASTPARKGKGKGNRQQRKRTNAPQL
jgi:hypothetical protein